MAFASRRHLNPRLLDCWLWVRRSLTRQAVKARKALLSIFHSLFGSEQRNVVRSEKLLRCPFSKKHFNIFSATHSESFREFKRFVRLKNFKIFGRFFVSNKKGVPWRLRWVCSVCFRVFCGKNNRWVFHGSFGGFYRW